MLGEDRHRHRPHEIDRPRREPIDVTGHHESGILRDLASDDRRFLIDVVHMQQPRRDDRALGDLVCPEVQLLVAIPQHDAFAGDLVDHDHRVLVAGVLDDGVGAIDAVVREFAADAAAVVVRAGGADVLGAQAETRARHQRGGHLATAADRLATDPHLGEIAGRLGNGGQPVDEVDGVGPEANHIPEHVGRGRKHD